MGIGIDGYFGWTCDGFEEKPDEKPKETKCPEIGCEKGWIILFTSRNKCKSCNGTGIIKKIKF